MMHLMKILFIELQGRRLNFSEHFSHVTIENGIHQKEGYIVRSDLRRGCGKEDTIPLTSVYTELSQASLKGAA